MYIKPHRFFCSLSLVFFVWLIATLPAAGYGVLSHQAVVDAAWEEGLQPLLRKRFPNATKEELQKAHAYAYGGSIVQDMGYFPFGSVFFTDLLHYVRSGDFVENLIASSETMDEFAFALGALAHYNADVYGHPLGTNRAVPLVYPKVKQEHGNMVTYADDPVSHIKTEFGFDVLQIARGNYAPEAYRDFIGFEVAPEVLERAFLKTYGLELKDVFISLPLAIGTYRYTIRGLMPDLTKAAWQAKKKDIMKERPGITQRKFVYHMSKAEYKKKWGTCLDKPNVFARFTAGLIRLLPKIGPLRPLAFVPPTPEAEKVFMESFNETVNHYQSDIKRLRGNGQKNLKNLQLDTGKPTASGEYKLTDEAYAKLVIKLADSDFKHVLPDLRQNLLQFYTDGRSAIYDKEIDEGEQKKEKEALDKLKALQL
ncbi:zinc dependent phospholipase C family protein [Pontibacter locisalis]|uniref:Zinc dependent phospholipase C family protein n=1 Tax=Pontibacter locisalis TaxID=1719035 RepID=A0ABW5IGK4_9BACT